MNMRDSCHFHPGKKNPRTGRLSCCRTANFSDPGCKSDFHCGRVFNAIKFSECIRKEETAISTHLPIIASPQPSATSSGLEDVKRKARRSCDGDTTPLKLPSI